MKRTLIIIAAFFITGCISGACGNHDPYKMYKYNDDASNKLIPGNNIGLFKGTPAWPLAIAVYEQDTDAIRIIAKKDTTLLSDTDKTLGWNLLDWAVYNYRYYSCMALLKAGADPNRLTRDGYTPFLHAVELSETTIFFKLLLAHGGNVNERRGIHTPLALSVSSVEVTEDKRSLEKVKTLVSVGADVNYADSSGGASAAYLAAVFDHYVILYYLVAQCGADYTHPFYTTPKGKPIYVTDLIMDAKLDKGSDQYKAREKVLDYIDDHNPDSSKKHY